MRRYDIKDNKSFSVKSEIARPFIEKEIKLRDRIGPYQYSLYQKKQLNQNSGGRSNS